MTQPSSLSTLVDLSEKLTDEAAAKLGIAIKANADLEQKLNLLKKYREEYSRKMQVELKAGRDMQHIRNFQMFLNKIDDAINGQLKLVVEAQKRVQIEKQNWQTQERKRVSYSTLEERAEKVENKKQAVREQKQNDEHGTRQAFYKQQH